MIKYKEMYDLSLKHVDDVKRQIMQSVVVAIKTISTKPIRIGNLVFYYVKHDGKDVPAYCYVRDYKENEAKFLPIYDIGNTGEYGWSDFGECCRIFELIIGALLRKK